MTDSLEFWNIVGKPADPTELNVGDAVNLEHGNLRAVKIVSEKWTNDEGLQQVRIRDPLPEDNYETPTMTIIATSEELE